MCHVRSQFFGREMRKNVSLGTLVLCNLLLLFSITGCTPGGNEPMTAQLTEADNGSTVDVGVGDQIIVTLPENPTTGYLWAVDQVDQAMLTLQASDYVSSDSPGATGSGGQRTFTFVAEQAGATDLQLKNWRDWEGDSSIVERFSLTVRIN